MNTEPYTIAGQGELLEPPALLSRIKTTYDQLAADIAALQDQATEQLTLAQKLAQKSGFDVSFGGAQPTPQPNGSDLAGLEAFLNKPYLLRPIQGDRYELIVPQFINLNAGWPARTEGQYVIYHVSRFIDFLTPLPGWLRDELGYEPPDFAAHLEGDKLVIDEGDARTIWDRFGGRRRFSSRRGDVLYLKPRSRFDIIRELVRQGVLPYRPQPIPASSLRAPKGDITLRPKQARDFETFLACGAVSVFATGGSGKTFFGMYAAETIAGPKLILAPRRAILDQWQARMRAHCPQAINETEFRTYQSLHRSLPRKTYGLIIYDEVQYMPADMGIKAAQLESIARCGRSAERSRRSLSATPWREDGNEDIIPALCGFPVGGDWSASPPPDSTVWIVDRPGHKADQVERLVSIPKAGKTIVYVYRLEFGQTLSQRLGVPFISGKTGNVLDTLHQHDTVVMSKVGDAGLSINATRVIEADFLGGRTEIGQRALRTQHAVRLSSRRSRPARGVSHDSDQKGIQHPQPPAIGAVCAGSGCALCGGGSGGVGVGLAETAVAQGVSGVR